MADHLLPTGWTAMPSIQIGTDTRDTDEPGGSKLMISFDLAPIEGVDEPLILDFIDFGLPSLQASSYSTALLAQKKWATMGISRIIAGDSIQGTIECSGPTYQALAGLIGAKGTARIEIPSQGWYSQWRVAILSVSGPAIADGDRMTGSLVLTVTNTAPNDKDEMGPVFGTCTSSTAEIAGATLSPATA